MTQFVDQVNIRLISQLISVKSRALHKLFKYFNDTAIYTFAIAALLVLFASLHFI